MRVKSSAAIEAKKQGGLFDEQAIHASATDGEGTCVGHSAGIGRVHRARLAHPGRPGTRHCVTGDGRDGRAGGGGQCGWTAVQAVRGSSICKAPRPTPFPNDARFDSTAVNSLVVGLGLRLDFCGRALHESDGRRAAGEGADEASLSAGTLRRGEHGGAWAPPGLLPAPPPQLVIQPGTTQEQASPAVTAAAWRGMRGAC